MNLQRALRTSRTVIDTFGWTGLALRARFEAKRSLGLFRVEPHQAGGSFAELPAAWPFAIDLDRVAEAVDRITALARAERVVAGEYEAYRSEWRRLPSNAAEWTMHPLTGFKYPDEPWPLVQPIAVGLNPTLGDVKDAWEPARFGWVFDLIRGYAIDRHRRFINAFHQYFSTFIRGCRPYHGVQWTCGQESSIRALTLLWAEAAFAGDSNADLRRTLHDILIHSAERIDDALEYGVSQRNNHGISEATALIALGTRFAAAHPAARRWLRRGRRWLEHCITDQIALDGWYLQHSFAYLRLALDQIVVAERTLRSSGYGLSVASRTRIAAAVRLLLTVIDDAGDVPNHGANDGAFVLGLSTSGYRDFRPTVTAAAATFDVPVSDRFFANAEVLAWLGAARPERSEKQQSFVVGQSGWISARHGRVRVFVRAGEYRSRPSHIDPAHVDVWLDDKPVAIDAGTFRYCAPPPWANALAAIDVHNTISIPSAPAAIKGPRFLWLSRPRSRIVGWYCADDFAHIELVNESWSTQGILHRRVVDLDSGHVVVRDEITSTEARDVVLHWLLADGARVPVVEASVEVSIEQIRASSSGVFGWHALEYARKLPALSLRIRATSPGNAGGASLRFVTTFSAPVDDH